MTRRFTLEAATDLAARAVRAAGASDEAALSLARATVSANAHGKGSSGFSHLMDYLAALRAGRIVGDAEPLITSPAPAAIHCDARGGIAQAGFDRAFDSLCERAQTFGLALFAQNGSYTTGELGYYPRRLAEAGLVAFAATSGPALMTVAGAKTPVYCTNPIAFAAPLDEGPPSADRPGVQRDRLCSAQTLRGTRRGAARGLGGRRRRSSRPPIRRRRFAARFSLSAARAAPTSRSWSRSWLRGLQARTGRSTRPRSLSGDRSPGAGLLVIAITPALLAPDFPQRLRLQLDRLAKLGVHIPGRRAAATEIELPDALAAEIERAGAP